MDEDSLQKLHDFSKVFNEAMDKLEKDQEEYWNSLTKEQQLSAFCAVARRIHKGDIVDKGSYRYVLYDVFEFGPEAYAPAQLAGYLDIHNSIFDVNTEHKLLKEFAKFYDLPDDAVSHFYRQTR
jgi:hypothetical protein